MSRVGTLTLLKLRRVAFVSIVLSLLRRKDKAMNPIDLIVTVCAVLAPATCEETHLVFSYSGSLQQCAMAAPPYIAQWVDQHPKWNAVRWRCEYPHRNDKADAAGVAPAG
jgi:hypothetical protein